MLTMTDKAAEKAKAMFEEKGVAGEAGLRVFVVGGGCSGYQYGMALAREFEDDDLVIDHSGVKIVVGSEENMRIAESRGFDVFGFKSTRRSEVSRMKPGDRLIFYLTKIMKFGGLAEVRSDYFEDHSKVFKSESKPGEDYPFRVKAKPITILSPEQYL